MCMWFGHLPQINFVPNTDLKNGSCNFMVSYLSSSFFFFFFFFFFFCRGGGGGYGPSRVFHLF